MLVSAPGMTKQGTAPSLGGARKNGRGYIYKYMGAFSAKSTQIISDHLQQRYFFQVSLHSELDENAFQQSEG